MPASFLYVATPSRREAGRRGSTVVELRPQIVMGSKAKLLVRGLQYE